MSRTVFLSHGSAALAVGAAALLFLTGCVGDMPHRGGWVAAPRNQRLQRIYASMDVPRIAPVPIAPVPVVVKATPVQPAKPKVSQSKVRPKPKRKH